MGKNFVDYAVLLRRIELWVKAYFLLNWLHNVYIHFCLIFNLNLFANFEKWCRHDSKLFFVLVYLKKKKKTVSETCKQHLSDLSSGRFHSHFHIFIHNFLLCLGFSEFLSKTW